MESNGIFIGIPAMHLMLVDTVAKDREPIKA